MIDSLFDDIVFLLLENCLAIEDIFVGIEVVKKVGMVVVGIVYIYFYYFM